VLFTRNDRSTISLEAARDLSIPELLRLLNEKLDVGFTKLQETVLPTVSAASLKSEVSFDRPPQQVPACVVMRFRCVETPEILACVLCLTDMQCKTLK
jgi:hypothetical protein